MTGLWLQEAPDPSRPSWRPPLGSSPCGQEPLGSVLRSEASPGPARSHSPHEDLAVTSCRDLSHRLPSLQSSGARPGRERMGRGSRACSCGQGVQGPSLSRPETHRLAPVTSLRTRPSRCRCTCSGCQGPGKGSCHPPSAWPGLTQAAGLCLLMRPPACVAWSRSQLCFSPAGTAGPPCGPCSLGSAAATLKPPLGTGLPKSWLQKVTFCVATLSLVI